MVRLATFALAVGLLGLVAAGGRASLHHPEDRTGVVPGGDDGKPDPFPFEELKRRRLVLRNVGNPDWPLEKIDPTTKEKVIDPNTGKPELSDRGAVDARIKKALAKRGGFGKKDTATLEEKVALAVDYLRFNRPDDAEGALKGPRADFLSNATLAHISAVQGQWSRAYTFLDIANEIADDKRKPVTSAPGTGPKDFAWQMKLNRGALLKFIKLRWDETKGPKPPPEDELPDHIWDVNFVNDAGQYEPGVLAAAEKAKLPGGDFTEALATVQQLVLWFPFDVRLYWLLGELYAAKGELKAAQDIMDECANSGRYSNRKVLMQHREAVTKAANVEPPGLQTPVWFTMKAVWYYFGAIGLVALYALVRAVVKWRRKV